MLDYQSTDTALKTLRGLSKKHREWLQLVISETRRLGPDSARAQQSAQSSYDAEQPLPEVLAVQKKTKMKLLKVDGNSKHERFFSVNPVDKSISWSERADGKKAKTERLSTVTESITACSVKPKYADRDFTIGTEDNTQLLLVAETPQQKQLWVDGCQAVISGQMSSAPRIGESLHRAVSSASTFPVPAPEPEPEPQLKLETSSEPEPEPEPEYYAEAPAAAPHRSVSFAGGPPLVESVRPDSNPTLDLFSEAALEPAPHEMSKTVLDLINADGVLDLTRGLNFDDDGPLDDGLGPSPRILEDSLFGQHVASVRRPKAAQYKFLPAAIEDLTSWLQVHAASVPGLFSRTLYEDEADQGVALLSNQLDEGIQGETLYYGQRPQTVAGVLKAWLRQMPEPLLTAQFFDEWVQASNAATREDCVERVTALVAKLPLANCEILNHLTQFLNEHIIASNTAEREVAEHLAPLLLWSDDEELPLQESSVVHRADMICVLLEERDNVFSKRARHPVRRASLWPKEAAAAFVQETKVKYGNDSVIVDDFVKGMSDYSNDKIDGEGLVRELCRIFPGADSNFVCRVVDKFLPTYVKEIDWIRQMLDDVDTDDEDTTANPHHVRLLRDPNHFEELVRANGQEQDFYRIVMEEVAAAKIQARVRGVLSRKKIAASAPRDYLASLVVVGVRRKPYTYYMGTTQAEVTIGRKTRHAADVDIDVSFAGDTKQSKVSRLHATVRYDKAADQFTLRCEAQRKKQHLVVDGMVLTSHDPDQVIGEPRADGDEPNEIRIGRAALYFSRKGAHPGNVSKRVSSPAVQASLGAAAGSRVGLLRMPIEQSTSASTAANTTSAPESVFQRPSHPILAATDGYQEDCEAENAPYLATLEADDGSVYYMDRADLFLGRDSASAREEGGPHVLLAHCGNAVSRKQLRIWYHMEGDLDMFVVQNTGKKSIKVNGFELKQGDQPIELPSRSHLEVGSVVLFFKNKFDVHEDKAATMIQRAVRNRFTAKKLERQAKIIRQAEMEQYGWWAKNLSKATETAAHRVQELDGEIETSKLQQERELLQSDERLAKQLTKQLKQLELKREQVRNASTAGIAPVEQAVKTAVEKELDAFGQKYIYNNHTGEVTHIGEQAARLVQRVYRGHKTRKKYLYDGTVFGALAERQIMGEEIKAAWLGYLEMREQRGWFLQGGREEPTGAVLRAWEGWNSVKLDRIAELPSIYIKHARDAGWNVPEPVPKFVRQARARQAKRLAHRSLEQHPDPEVQKEAQLNKEQEEITVQLQRQVDELEAKQRRATVRLSETPPDKRTDPQRYREWLIAAQQSAQITTAHQQLARRVASNPKQAVVTRAGDAPLQPQPRPRPEPEPEPEPEPAMHWSRRSQRQNNSRPLPSRVATLQTANPEPVLPPPTVQQSISTRAMQPTNTQQQRPAPRVDTGRLVGLRTAVQQQTAEVVSLLRSQIDAIASPTADPRVSTPPDKRTDPEGYRRFLVSTQRAASRASGPSSDTARLYAAAGAALRPSPTVQPSPLSFDDDDETESDTEPVEGMSGSQARRVVEKDDSKKGRWEKEEEQEEPAQATVGNEAETRPATADVISSMPAPVATATDRDRDRDRDKDRESQRVAAPILELPSGCDADTSNTELIRETNAAGPGANAGAKTEEKRPAAPQEKRRAAYHPEEDPDLETDEGAEDSDSDNDAGGSSDIAGQLAQLEQLYRAGHIDGEELAQYRAVLVSDVPGSDSEQDDDEEPPSSRPERPAGPPPQRRPPVRSGDGASSRRAESLSWS